MYCTSVLWYPLVSFRLIEYTLMLVQVLIRKNGANSFCSFPVTLTEEELSGLHYFPYVLKLELTLTYII